MSFNILVSRSFFKTNVFLSTKNLSTTSHRLPTGFNQPTAFSLFIKDNSKPGIKASEIVKQVAISWKQLDDASKKSYYEKAVKIGDERRANYAKLSDEERFRLSEKQKEERKCRITRIRRKVLREQHEKMGRPKQPPNAFAIFVSNFFKNYNKATSVENPIIVSKAAAAWKSLSDNEKEIYISQSTFRREAYAKELQQWKTEHEASENNKTKKLLRNIKKLKLDQ